jgi:cation diffusion facilitator family transporter
MERKRVQQIYKTTLIGSIVNLLLMLLKFAAGFWGRSAAMMADAVHSLSDFVTDIVVVAFVRISSKPSDENHDYGHAKYETLSTIIIGLLLLFVGAGLLWDSGHTIYRALHGEALPRPGIIALVVAIFSILSKGLLFKYTLQKGKEWKSSALVANAWHHNSDALSSLGTTVGIAGAILLGDKWAVLDPIAAFVVSFFILKIAVELILPGVEELLEKSLPKEIEDEILAVIARYPDVYDVHNLRTRSLGNHYSIEVHIRMEGNLSLTTTHARATEIEHELKTTFGAQTHVVIHVEPLK